MTRNWAMLREWLVAVMHAPLSAFWLVWAALAGHGLYAFLHGDAGIFAAAEGALTLAGVIRLIAHVWHVPAWPRLPGARAEATALDAGPARRSLRDNRDGDGRAIGNDHAPQPSTLRK